jgi:GTP-binding protein
MVAIVGRVNVGKSTFFNRLLRAREAIEHEMAGVTRDNNYTVATLGDRPVLLVDTGGFSWQDESGLEDEIRAMARAASQEADVVVQMVDASTGPVDEDLRLSRLLLRGGAKVVLVANKVDRLRNREQEIYSFLSLGLGDPLPCSAVHGRGVGPIVDAIVERLPPPADMLGPAGLRVAVVGRPNVGKSSLVNMLIGSKRVIVHERPGTTRDTVDVWFRRGSRDYHFLDTAGLRRRTKVDEPVEYYSVLRAMRAIQRSQVCVFVLDAADGVARQDARIAALIGQSYKAVVVAANKWDLMAGDDYKKMVFEAERQKKLSFLDHAPFLQVSALKRRGASRIFEAVEKVHAAASKRVDTGPLNRFLQRLAQTTPPPAHRGKEVAIRYGSQVATEPPTFVLHANRPQGVAEHYRRFLVNRLREEFGFEGTPIKVVFRGT